MRIVGVTESDMAAVAYDLSIRTVFSNGVGTVVLRPDTDIKDADERPFQQYNKNTGHRINAVCWHGHYAFMMALFNKFPQVKIVTFCATYNGREDFIAKAEATKEKPYNSAAMCICDEADVTLAYMGRIHDCYKRQAA